MQPIRRIVLVGHCGYDGSMLRAAAVKLAPGVEVTAADSAAALACVADRHSLLLVNRVLDGGFATSNGIALIRELAGRGDPPRMMLISNYADAQAAAEQAGARPGFGKADVGKPLAAQRMAAALGDAAGAPPG
jgi:hypothetical protein